MLNVEPTGRTDPGDPDADPESVARTICLRLLTAAPRTRAQLADALRRRGIQESATAAVLDRLTEVGLIDDDAFSRAWVTSRQAGRGLARRALAEELRRRGVDRGVVAAAVAAVDDDSEAVAARTLVARRLPLLAGQPVPVRRRRLAGMLLRKGYPPGLVQRVVREALDGDGDGDASADEVDIPG